MLWEGFLALGKYLYIVGYQGVLVVCFSELQRTFLWPMPSKTVTT